MKQLFLASTLFQVASLAAGIDSGAYDRGFTPAATTGGAGKNDEQFQPPNERILILSNNATVLELTTPLDQVPGATTLLSRFDRVIHLNELLTPNHPSSWVPNSQDLPLWESHFRSAWMLGTEQVELVLESPQVNPAIALGRIFHDAVIRVHADGLMSYGPTRSFIPLTNGQRLTSLHYLPLVEGLVPRLLSEYEITPVPVDLNTFRAIVDELVKDTNMQLPTEILDLDPAATAIGFGQYLSALNILSPEEETELHLRFISTAHARGMQHFIFKPHPASPPETVRVLGAYAENIGMTFHVYSSPVLAEALVSVFMPSLVIGCFSTALITASTLYGIEAQAVGTELLLERVTPYHNSNRIPVTITDALLNSDDGAPTRKDGDELQHLVDSVSYAMQPEIAAEFRDVAVEYLKKHQSSPSMKYFKRRRLTALDLPGSIPQRTRLKTVARKTLGIGQSFAKESFKSLIKNERLKRPISS